MRSVNYVKMIQEALYHPISKNWASFYEERNAELKKKGNEYSAQNINLLDLMMEFVIPLAYAGECMARISLEMQLMSQDDWSERPIELGPLSTKGFVACLKEKTSREFIANVCHRIAGAKQRLEGDLYEAIINNDYEMYAKLVDGRGLDDDDEVYNCKLFMYFKQTHEFLCEMVDDMPEEGDFDTTKRKMISRANEFVNEMFENAGMPESERKKYLECTQKGTDLISEDDDVTNTFLFVLNVYVYLYFLIEKATPELKQWEGIGESIDNFIEKRSNDYPVVEEFLRFNVEDFLSGDGFPEIDYKGVLSKFRECGGFSKVPVSPVHSKDTPEANGNENKLNTLPSVDYIDSIIVDNYFATPRGENGTYMYSVKTDCLDVNKFRELMRYIIQNDFIDGDERTIRQFLYVFTGHGMKPDNQGKILWCGDPCYLFLLSKALYFDKGKMGRMPTTRLSRFFECNNKSLDKMQKNSGNYYSFDRYKNDKFAELIARLFYIEWKKKK